MNDTPASPVTLAEVRSASEGAMSTLAHATEDLPLETLAAPTSCGASLATRSLAEVFTAEAEGRDPLAPSPEDIATLTTQYRKAVNGLYEAYLFGQMLAQVKARLEQFSGDATRGTARETTVGNNGNALAAPGWNAGTGLKAWLAQHCPEINYSTARRFLAVAEKTNAALAESEAVPASPRAGVTPAAGEGARSPFPSETPFLLTFPEETIRAFLEGKSQRQLLGRGGAREEAGRPRKNWVEALGASPEAAMKRLEEALAPLNELVVVKQTHRLLAAADLETLRAAIDLLHERVHADA